MDKAPRLGIFLLALVISVVTAPPFSFGDDVVNDDLVVIGATCSGLSCMNNEAFGFEALRLNDPFPSIEFLDTSAGDFPSNDWRIKVNDDGEFGNDFFRIEDLTGSTIPFHISSGVPSNTLFLSRNSGIGGLTGTVGINTNAPDANLTIVDAVQPTLSLEVGGTGEKWTLLTNSSNFVISNGSSSTAPIVLAEGAPDDSFSIDNFGNVTFGGETANSRIHVRSNSGTNPAKVIVEEDHASVAPRSLLDLVNKGPSKFTVQNKETGATWNFGMFNDDLFHFSKDLTFFAVNSNGEFAMIRNALITMLLSSSGNLSISGTLTEGSSKTIKTDFSDLNPTEVLEKVETLPVSSWRYKSEEETVRHVGPFAEDFKEVFGLGTDDSSIRVADLSGVALSAIKGLNQKLKEETQKRKTLENKLAALESKLATLLERIDQETN